MYAGESSLTSIVCKLPVIRSVAEVSPHLRRKKEMACDGMHTPTCTVLGSKFATISNVCPSSDLRIKAYCLSQLYPYLLL